MSDESENVDLDIMDIIETETFLCALVDRMQVYSEWKFPAVKWTRKFYCEYAVHWAGKEDVLESLILEYEAEMEKAKS